MSGYQAYLWRPWIDHSENPFSGLVVTVPADSGALILPALALIVTIAGDAAWAIGAYALHQYRSSNTPQTGLFRMLQVALRNSGSSIGSALEIVQTGHAWGGRVRGARRRAYQLAVWPVSIKVLFIIAGVFVGRVTIAAYKANNILLVPTNCGLESFIPSNLSVAAFQSNVKHANDTRQSRSYVNQCYNSPNGTLGCVSLPVQRLPHTTRTNVKCPFGDLCWPNSESAVALFTPKLDSHTHLGINAAPDDRVEFQMTTQCSVITVKNLTAIVPDPNSNGNSSFFQVNIGLIDGTSLNYTWFYPSILWIQSVGYTTRAYLHYSKTNGTIAGWQPIPQLRFPDGDTTAIFIAQNSVMYQKPVFDPVFSANGTYTYSGDADESAVWYQPDHYFSTLACVERMDLCNPRNGVCSAPLGANNLTPLMNTSYFGFSGIQLATAQRVVLAWTNSHIYDVVSGQSGEALAANSLLTHLWSPGLPDNQWQIEVNGWFETSLANMQHRIVEFPTNTWAPDSTSTDNYIGVIAAKDWHDGPGSNEGMMELCHRQLVRSSGEYQSFHVAGIIIIAVVSGALIMTSWTLDCCISKRKDRRDIEAPKFHKRLAYIADGKMQLMRMALKPAGYDNGWEREMKYIPARRALDRHAEQDISAPSVRDDAVTISRAPRLDYGALEIEKTAYKAPEEGNVTVIQAEVSDSSRSTESFITGQDQSRRLRE